ncbi:Protein of unknown function [Gryllus bimaculatus]|nr:Protein of unknown function [Gryllus bimaculatus]
MTLPQVPAIHLWKSLTMQQCTCWLKGNGICTQRKKQKNKLNFTFFPTQKNTFFGSSYRFPTNYYLNIFMK